MQLQKTEKGRGALATHAGALSMRERRVLILCDGARTLDDLMRMVGVDAGPVVHALQQGGYLAGHDGRATPPAAAPGPAAHGTPAAPPAGASAATPARAAARRSLAASKMYVLDMLQLKRSVDAVGLRSVIQASPPDELVDALLAGLELIVADSAASYGSRVTERLAEILPEDALPALEAWRTTRTEMSSRTG